MFHVIKKYLGGVGYEASHLGIVGILLFSMYNSQNLIFATPVAVITVSPFLFIIFVNRGKWLCSSANFKWANKKHVHDYTESFVLRINTMDEIRNKDVFIG